MMFYKNSLLSSEQAIEYCQNRDLNQKVIQDFNIGYSPDFDKLIQYLLVKGYKKEDIFRSGVAIENNGELKDRFAHRLIFPITNLNGKVVAFSGRIIEKSDMAKYVNSPETEIFVKGETLYNYSSAIDSIKKEKKMYICEGFMDAIAMHRSGINNVVALMGTAFTKEHLKLFKYLGVKIILTLDADDAGNVNANKLANELLDLEVNVSVIANYKDVKDLDEFLVKYGKENLKEYIENSEMGAFEFNFYVASKLKELENNENKKRFLKKMCLKISKMSDEDIDIYTEKLHNELHFSTSTIKTLINEYKKNSSNEVINEVKNYKKMSKYQDLQLRIISSMLDSPEAIQIYVNSMVFLPEEQYRKIGLLIGEYYKENLDSLNMEYLIADLFTKVSTDFANDEQLIKTLSLIDSSKDQYPSYSKKAFNDYIFELQEILPLEEEINRIKEEIKFANSNEQINEFIRQTIALKQSIASKKAKRLGGN